MISLRRHVKGRQTVLKGKQEIQHISRVKVQGGEKHKEEVEGLPLSLTVLELLCPAASPPPAHDHFWLRSEAE